MRVHVKWETKIEYSRVIEIEDADLAEFGGDAEAYLAEYTDQVLADYEEDFEDGELTADVGEREVLEVEEQEQGESSDD